MKVLVEEKVAHYEMTFAFQKNRAEMKVLVLCSGTTGATMHYKLSSNFRPNQVIIMSSVSDNPVFVLNVGGEPPPITQNETSWITNFYRIPVIAITYIKRMWTDYFLPATLGGEGLVPPGSVTDNPVVILTIKGEEMLAKANNQTSFVTDFWSEELS
ncbi:hypothetical protein E3N88_08022 [Mikania micrantha]|uniref:Uncharacterized protein n=1 Tax=Mikania micrantha TaxID=192012 RepID=A0A5N6PG32_9ASTR|nr:hypothetical protein E3N88_08022 [Mikania micrantha]